VKLPRFFLGEVDVRFDAIPEQRLLPVAQRRLPEALHRFDPEGNAKITAGAHQRRQRDAEPVLAAQIGLGRERGKTDVTVAQPQDRFAEPAVGDLAFSNAIQPDLEEHHDGEHRLAGRAA